MFGGIVFLNREFPLVFFISHFAARLFQGKLTCIA